MAAETPISLEQTQADVDFVRRRIESLYDLPVVKDAVTRHWSRQVDSSALEQFKMSGKVTIPTSDFQFVLFPPGEEDSNYTLGRIPLREDEKPTMEGMIVVYAKPDNIQVSVHDSSLPYAPPLKGPDAIVKAREVLLSFLMQTQPR